MTTLSKQLRTNISGMMTHEGSARELRGLLENIAPGAGDIWYVDSGAGADTNVGDHANRALATLDAAFGKVTANNGDIVYVMPGHAETVTAAITVDVVGVTVIGLGVGTSRPSITGNVATDTMTITAANTIIHNLLFNEATAVTGAAINVGAANVTIQGCQFDLGANDAEAITIEAAGDNCTIQGNAFKVTANGPVAAIEIEGTSSDLVVRRNLFDGGSDTTAWDAAHINSTAAATGIRITDNDFRFCLTAQEFITLTAITEPAIILRNHFKSGAALASNLNGPTTFYVNSVKGNDVTGAGTSIHTPAATIDFAVGLCSNGVGDVIEVASEHAEDLGTSTSLVVDISNVTIRGVGGAGDKPRLTYITDNTPTISITGANVKLENLYLLNNIASGVLIGITLGAAADGCILKDIEMEEVSADKEWIVGISVAAGCNNVTIDGLIYHGFVGGTGLSCIDWVGASNHSVVKNCYLHGDWSASVIDGLAAASIGILYRDILFYQDDGGAGLGIDESDTSSGLMIDCHCLCKNEGVEGYTGNVMAYSQCYTTNVLNKQGFLLPLADS